MAIQSTANPRPETPPHGSTAASRPAAFFPALDGLRAVAFLMVFGQHYLFLPWGWAGVQIFFVLSGFLITGILLDTADRPDRFRRFYLRRTLRIFPLYYAVLVLPLVFFRHNPAVLLWPLYLGNYLRFLGPRFMSDPGLHAVADLWILPPHWRPGIVFLGHLWSLCVEEQFYLVWPAVVFLLRRRGRLLALCLAVVVLEPVARTIAAGRLPGWMLSAEALYRMTPFQLDGLLLGGALAILWRGTHRDTLLRAGRWLAAILGAVAAVYLAVSIWQCWHDAALRASLPGLIPYRYGVWHETWGYTVVNALAAAMLLCCLVPGNPLHRLLALGPLRWMGRISYGLYIFHDLLHGAAAYLAHGALHLVGYLGHPGTQNLLTAAVALTATCGLAALSFRYLESPLLALKERWS